MKNETYFVLSILMLVVTIIFLHFINLQLRSDLGITEVSLAICKYNYYSIKEYFSIANANLSFIVNSNLSLGSPSVPYPKAEGGAVK